MEPFYPRDCSFHSCWKRTREEKKMSSRAEISLASGPRATLSDENARTLRTSKGRNPPLMITWCPRVVSTALVYPALPTGRKERGIHRRRRENEGRALSPSGKTSTCNESVWMISLWNMKVWINNWFSLFFYFYHTYVFKLRKRQDNYRTVENSLFYKLFFYPSIMLKNSLVL